MNGNVYEVIVDRVQDGFARGKKEKSNDGIKSDYISLRCVLFFVKSYEIAFRAILCNVKGIAFFEPSFIPTNRNKKNSRINYCHLFLRPFS